jgi:hypothetical protein
MNPPAHLNETGIPLTEAARSRPPGTQKVSGGSCVVIIAQIV